MREIELALRANAGNCVAAAEALAKADEGNGNRTITPRGIRHHLQNKPALRQAVDECVQEILDIAEGTVVKAMMAGDANLSLKFLELRGKERGYTRRQEFTGNNGGPMRLNATLKINPQEAREAYQRMLEATVPKPKLIAAK